MHIVVTVLVVVILLKLFHHLSVQTITVRLAIKLHVNTLECSTLMIHYRMVKTVVIVKLVVANVLLFLGFISPCLTLLLMLLRCCCDEGTNNEDVSFEQYEIYVK